MLPLHCPVCSVALEESGPGLACSNGHAWTTLGFALVTNTTALQAIWAAIRALEDDAAGLEFMARKEDRKGAREAGIAVRRREEAAGARQAADVLREHAELARRRLDALSANAAEAALQWLDPR